MNKARLSKIRNQDSPLGNCFGALRLSRRKALIPFITGGYPSVAASENIARAMLSAGADILEIGMPFSDPVADGPAIQMASSVALSQGVRLKDILLLVHKIRRVSCAPIILMGYINPILRYGQDRFLRDAEAAGVNGLIIPDVPLDESKSLRVNAAENGVDIVPLIAPTTTTARRREIDKIASSFVYAVTVAGITGTRQSFDHTTDLYLASVRRSLKHPFVAGFGVSSVESACRLASRADGIVIGSAIVERIAKAGNAKAPSAAAKFVAEIRRGLDK